MIHAFLIAWLAMMGHIVIPEDGHIDQVGKAREVEKSGPAKKSCYGQWEAL